MKFLTSGVLAVCFAVSVQAQVAYSSFGSGDSYRTGSIWVVGAGVDQIAAFQFESATTGIVSTIDFAFSSDNSGDITATLFEDSSNEKGAVVGSWTKAVPGGYAASVQSITNSNSAISLTAGSKYWLQLETPTTNLYGGWYFNDLNLSSRMFLSQSGNGFYLTNRAAAYRVSTSVVPEPASMAALGLGALALVRKRRKQS